MKAERAEGGIVLIFCPACDCSHGMHTVTPNHLGAKWNFNGSLESPTFTPSIDIKYKNDKGEVIGRCHSNIEKGEIEFHLDCTHKMKGKKVTLPDI